MFSSVSKAIAPALGFASSAEDAKLAFRTKQGGVKRLYGGEVSQSSIRLVSVRRPWKRRAEELKGKAERRDACLHAVELSSVRGSRLLYG